MAELSEEDVFANDIDPLDAIREIRKEEGVPEDELPVSDAESSSQEDVDTGNDDDDDFSENFEDDKEAGDSKDKETSDKLDDDDSADDKDSDKADDDAEDDSETDDNGDEEEEQNPDEIKHEFTANGKKYEFTQKEMLEQFEVIFGQAVDYTQKTQKIAPYRKMISALEQEGITDEQLNIAIDALKGNKGALQSLLKSNNIDAYDLSQDGEDEENPYTPSEYGKNEVQMGIEEITSEISKDPEYKITVDVIDEQWDSKSRQQLSSNPRMIRGLHNDIKSGVYDKVAPVAMKMKVLDGNTKSDIEYYMLAGEQVLSEEEQNSASAEQTVSDDNKSAQDAEDDFDQASSEARRKRSATPTRKRTDRKGVIDYLDDDDENFDAWYKNLMAKN
jgi:hypothetical protein